MVVQTPEGILEVRNATIRANRIEADSYKFDSTSNLEIGTANLFVDTTTSNVGIGTNAPLVRFDVNGDIQTNNRIFNSGFGMIIPLVQSKNMRVVQAYTGSDVSFTVPSGVTRIYTKMWGAGGSGGYKSGWNYGSPGGAGGFTHGVIATTPGETLTLMIGQGGHRVGSTIYGGGGLRTGQYQNIYGGNGGGRTAIRRGSTELATAGGGGGGGATRSALGNGEGNRGGAGGGLHGQNGASGYDGKWEYAGGGGGQSLGDVIDLGGAFRTASYSREGYGSQFQGGVSQNFGGSGGGGWYGGGAGTYSEDNTMAGGGGGSGYVGGCLFGQTFTGHFSEPANIADVDYAPGIGGGGIPYNSAANDGNPPDANIPETQGRNGFMVIYY